MKKKIVNYTVLMLFLALSLNTFAQKVLVKKSDERVSISNALFSLDFNLKSGEYKGIDKKNNKTVFANARFDLDAGGFGWERAKYNYSFTESAIADTLGKGVQLSIKHVPMQGYALPRTLEIRIYEDLPFAVLGFSVTNPNNYTVRIKDAKLLDKGILFPKQKIEKPQTLRGGAGAEPNFVEQTMDMTAYNSAMLTAKVDNNRFTIVAGGLKYKEFLREVRLSAKDQSLTISVEDPQGKNIPAKQTYQSSDDVFLDFVTVDPFKSLETYGLAMRKANRAKPNMYNFPTLCGWLVSQSEYGDGKPRNNSPALVEELKLAKKNGFMNYTPVAVRLEPDGYCYSNFGDTQQGWWDNKHWADSNIVVPALMKPYETFGKFDNAVRALGGIPFTYFQGSLPSNDFALAHPDWMLNNDISMLHAEHYHHMPFVKYDFTDPGFKAYTLNMWKGLGAQGLRGIKFDYPESAWAKDGGFEDKSYTTTSAYRQLFQLCREGLGHDAFIHERALGEYGTPRLDITAGIVDLQRVWDDTSDFEPEMASRIGLRWYKNRAVFSYYPDGKSLLNPKTKQPLPTNERRTMLTQIGLISGRLELATAFENITKEMKHDITRLYPVLQEAKSFRPVDMLMGKKNPEVYVYDISPSWSQIILCNNTKEAKNVSAPLSGLEYEVGSLGLNPDKKYYVYDFWNNNLVGVFSGKDQLNIPLEKEQALVYSVHEVENHPQFISTNRHIMQGMMDLENVKWNSQNNQYSGTSKVVGGETMEIVIALNGKKALKVKVDQGKASIEKTSNGLLVLKISTKNNASVNWTVSFN
ncbi:hypothetical protein EZJ43_09510 [Pedobacter changchengzhani]|uniref:Uncharacterized protein n=1 Tax=Pedobacter changchengzhani TaxID=2529274 RepID=A0A4R5MKN1_9SPHI|nr:hypothetical protein [Pedobacter changchengzhani]TDG36230.1 hypothetical protein EZJ43_09510 [Pedobacter changchengzhani]